MEDIAYLKEHGEVKSYAFTVYSETRDVVRFPDPQEYEIHFDQPFRNVVGLDVVEALIPRSQFLVDIHNNKLVMFIAGSRYVFEVPVGDYDRDGLEDALNSVLNPRGVRASFYDSLRAVVNFTSRSILKLDVTASTMARFLGFRTTFLASEGIPSSSVGSSTAPVKYYWSDPYDENSETIGGVYFVNGTATNLERINALDAWAFGVTLKPTPITSVRYPLFTPILTTPTFEFSASQTSQVRIRARFPSEMGITSGATLTPTNRLPGTFLGSREPSDRYGFFHTLDSEMEGGSYGHLEPSSSDLDTRELFVGDGQWSGGLRIAPRRQPGYWKTSGVPIDHLDENVGNPSWTIFATLSYREQSELNAALFRYGTRETFLGISLQGDRIVYERVQTKQVPHTNFFPFANNSDSEIVEDITTTTLDDPTEYGTVSFELRVSSVSVPEGSYIAVLFENGWFPGYVSERVMSMETIVTNVPWIREEPKGTPVQIRWSGEDYPIDLVQSIIPGNTYATLFVGVANIENPLGSQTDIQIENEKTVRATIVLKENPRISFENEVDPPGALSSVEHVKKITISYDPLAFPVDVTLDHGLTYTWSFFIEAGDDSVLAFQTPLFDNTTNLVGTASILDAGADELVQKEGFVAMTIQTEDVELEEVFSWEIQPTSYTLERLHGVTQTFTLGGVLGEESTLRSISVYIQDDTFLDQPVSMRVRLQDESGVVLDEFKETYTDYATLDVSIHPETLTEETPMITRQMTIQILHDSTFLRVDANNHLSMDSGTVGTFSLTSRSSPDEDDNQTSYTWKDTLTETYLSSATPETRTVGASIRFDEMGKIYRLKKVGEKQYTISWVQPSGMRTYLARDPSNDSVLRPFSVHDPGTPTHTDTFLLWTIRVVTSASAVTQIHLNDADQDAILPSSAQTFLYPEYVQLSGTGRVSNVDTNVIGATIFNSTHRVNASITNISDKLVDENDNSSYQTFDYTVWVLCRDPNVDIDLTASDVSISFHARTVETSRRVLLDGLVDNTPYFLEMGVKSDGTVLTRVRYDGTLSEIEDTTPVQGIERFGLLDERVSGLQSASLEFPIDTSSNITLGPVSSIQDVVLHKNKFVDSTMDHPTLNSTFASLSGSDSTLVFTWGGVDEPEYRWLGVMLTGLELDQVSDMDANVPGYTIRIQEKDRIVYELDSPMTATSFSFTFDLSKLGSIERFRAVHALGHPTTTWDKYKDEMVTISPDTPHGFLIDIMGGIAIRNEISGETQRYKGIEVDIDTEWIPDPKTATIERTTPTLSWILEDVTYGDTGYLNDNFTPLYQVRESPLFVYSDDTGAGDDFSWPFQSDTFSIEKMQSVTQTFIISEDSGKSSTLRSISILIQDDTFLDQSVFMRVRLKDSFGATLDEFTETYGETDQNRRISSENAPDIIIGEETVLANIKKITFSYDRYEFPVDVTLDNGRLYTWSVFFVTPPGVVLAFQTPLFQETTTMSGTATVLDNETGELVKKDGFVAMTVKTERTQHTIMSPGVTILSPGSFVKLSVPEIEKHSYKHQNYNNRVMGITSFFLSKEFEHQWFEFPETPASYEVVNPIASLVRMTFRFLQDDDIPYNFRGVDHVLKLVIRFLVPKLDISFQSRIAPQYDASRILYTGTSECLDSDQPCEIRPHDETDDLLRIHDMDQPPTLKGQDSGGRRLMSSGDGTSSKMSTRSKSTVSLANHPVR